VNRYSAVIRNAAVNCDSAVAPNVAANAVACYSGATRNAAVNCDSAVAPNVAAKAVASSGTSSVSCGMNPSYEIRIRGWLVNEGSEHAWGLRYETVRVNFSSALIRLYARD
jgi:hypothetical protein